MTSLPTYENNRLARLIPQDYFQQLVTTSAESRSSTMPSPPSSPRDPRSSW